MQRQLPTISIDDLGGLTFIVDVNRSELREAMREEICLSFNDMQDNGAYYSFSYDKITSRIIECPSLGKRDILQVQIPQMQTLDPEGMAERYGKTLEELVGKSDFEIMVDQVMLAERLGGRLPHIDIAGDDFSVNVEWRELRKINDPKIRIPFADFDYSDDRLTLYSFFSGDSKRLMQRNLHFSYSSNDMMILVIPAERRLDPIGVIMQYPAGGKGYRPFLRRNPLIMKHKATLLPLSEIQSLVSQE